MIITYYDHFSGAMVLQETYDLSLNHGTTPSLSISRIFAVYLYAINILNV